MKAIYLFSLLFGLVLYSSCKKDQGQPAVSESPASKIDTTHRTVAPPAASTSKVDTTLGHDYTFLTHELFIVNGAYVPGKDPKDKPYQGVWIDLQPDGTYKYGRHKQTLYTGTWAYNHSVTTLLLKPDGKKDKNSEWHVQFNDQMMVWVGTRTFGDNGIQLQLLRRTELPD